MKVWINIVFQCIIFTLFSCEQREWNNPFDPDCPKELFTPTNFEAIQEENSINLTWSQSNNNISGFKIMRSTNDVTWTEIGNLDKNIFTWTDSNILGGEKYTYKIVAVAGKNESNEKIISLTPVLFATLTTTSVTAITSTTATSGGNITNDGGATITARGVCYGVAQNPNVSGSKTTNGSGTGSFVSNITGLTPNTTYYICAYATNSSGTAYGNQLNFKTSGNLPSVLTVSANATSCNTATAQGNVQNDGGSPVNERGVCWSTSQNPTTANNKTSDGTGLGNFSSSLTGLSGNTIYYLRAYATNSTETAYGSQVTFTTPPCQSLATVITNAVTIFTSTSATMSGNVTNDGNSTVTERGVCYATTQNPTIANNKVFMGSGTGAFSNSVTGLSSNTTYYIRAYAINGQGTAYGAQVSFFTSEEQPQTVTDIDGNVYQTITIGTQVWTVENLKTTKYRDGTDIPNITNHTNWVNLTTGAYCWYNNDVGNKLTYGALYNWYAVIDNHGLCPTGWHVPTSEEWQTLYNYVGGNGGKLKETGTIHWNDPNTGATNESGFTGLPGGYNSPQGFLYIGELGNWWSTQYSPSQQEYALTKVLSYYHTGIGSGSYYKYSGCSVRCIKD